MKASLDLMGKNRMEECSLFEDSSLPEYYCLSVVMLPELFWELKPKNVTSPFSSKSYVNLFAANMEHWQYALYDCVMYMFLFNT